MANLDHVVHAHEAPVSRFSNSTHEPRLGHEWIARRTAWVLGAGSCLAFWIVSLWVCVNILGAMAQ